MNATADIAKSLIIRLAEPRDLPGFVALAQLTGPGFTSLPAHEDKIASMLSASTDATHGAPGTIMLAMEDRKSGCIAGCAAVKRGGEKRHGFANFRIIRDAAGVVRSLTVSDDYSNLTEIGGLFVHPDYRSKGVGKALARSRYLYLATAPQSFGPRVFAELRGVIKTGGVSPFYDAACKPWLKMSFTEADKICAGGDNARLAAMFPEKPMSADNFPAEAIDAIGNCHESGMAARAMLEQEGFRFDGVVDLLDGGALVVANTVGLTSLRESLRVHVKPTENIAKAESLLFATTQPGAFRCVAGRGALSGNNVLCSEDVCNSLLLQEGDVIRVSRLTSRTRKTGIARSKPLESLVE